MRDSLLVTLTHPFSKDAPEVCPLCDMHPPTFHYLLISDFHVDHDLQELDGYCCVRCAESFLAAMEHRVAAELDQSASNIKAELDDVPSWSMELALPGKTRINRGTFAS